MGVWPVYLHESEDIGYDMSKHRTEYLRNLQIPRSMQCGNEISTRGANTGLSTGFY